MDSSGMAFLKNTIGLLLAAILTACGGGGSTTSENPDSGSGLSIGGQVTGLNSGNVSLQLNGLETLTLSSNQSFKFTTQMNASDSYTVAISSNTTGQTCSVSNGSGTIQSSSVKNVTIICLDGNGLPPTYTVGGQLTGLESGSISISLNDSETLTLNNDQSFTFSTEFDALGSYLVAITENTSSKECSITNESGTIQVSDINNVTINCVDEIASPTYTVGGQLTGLDSGSVSVRLNNAETLVLSSDQTFTFTTALETSDAYSVEIDSNTSGQTCSIDAATGTIQSTSISNVAVSCTPFSGFNLQSFGIQTNSPSSVVVAGLRVTDRSTGIPVEGLDKGAFQVEENGQVLGLEAFVDAEQANDAKLDLRTVIILDVSTSLLPSDIATIKAAAKSAIYSEDASLNKNSLLVDGQTVAIYTFDSSVQLISDFTDNLEDLGNAIDGIDESLVTRANSTNLLTAVTTGVSRWSNNFGLDSAQFGYAIVISDGDHNTDNRTPADIQSSLTNKDVYAIALGSNVSTASLAEITGSADRVFSADDVSDLTATLYDVQQAALSETKGLYRVYYATPKRSGTQSIEIGMTNNQACTSAQINSGNCSETITGSYSANGFNDVVPEVKITSLGSTTINASSELALEGDISLKAKLRWINVTPNFSFSLANEEGTQASLTQVSNSEYTLTIPEFFGQADVEVSESNTQLSNTITIIGDADADGIANNTDTDDDNDGVPDISDLYPFDPNESADSDGDGVGDNADFAPNDATETVDTDGDGVGDNADWAPNNAAESRDSDGDGVGDNADWAPNDASETVDADGDGVGDNADWAPNDPSESVDSDGDGVGNNADFLPYDASEAYDSDGDGVGDNSDFAPNDANETVDSDGDGVGDNADLDRDGDGVNNDLDALPDDASETQDTDGDGIGNNTDPDIDGDGVLNGDDFAPNDASEAYDQDGDGVGDNADEDRDGDGVNNDSDALPDNATETSDLDGDGVGDNTDPDIDGDGVTNNSDFAPYDASEAYDQDGDGIGDNADDDRDGDGVNNWLDDLPDNPNETVDSDGDGIGDNSDSDVDGDGADNSVDLYPNDGSRFGYIISGTVSIDIGSVKVLIESEEHLVSDGESFSFELIQGVSYELEIIEPVSQSCTFDSNNYTANANKNDFEIDCINKIYISDLVSAIPDLNFADCISSETLGKSLISEVVRLNCNRKGIVDLSGVEAFSNLSELILYWNELSGVDVSYNTLLKSLNISENNLLNLDVSQNLILESLNLDGNNISVINIQNNPLLTTFSVQWNNFSSVNLSVHAVLKYLGLTGNNIRSLDLTANTALAGVYASDNMLSSAPLGISNIVHPNATIDLTENNFSSSAEMELTTLKQTYNYLTW